MSSYFASFFFVLMMSQGFTAEVNLIGCRTLGSNRLMIQLLQTVVSRKTGSSSQGHFHRDGRCSRTEGYSNYKTMQVHSDCVQSSIQKEKHKSIFQVWIVQQKWFGIRIGDTQVHLCLFFFFLNLWIWFTSISFL